MTTTTTTTRTTSTCLSTVTAIAITVISVCSESPALAAPVRERHHRRPSSRPSGCHWTHWADRPSRSTWPTTRPVTRGCNDIALADATNNERRRRPLRSAAALVHEFSTPSSIRRLRRRRTQ